MTRLLRHDQTVHREIDGATKYNDIIEECRKKKLDDAAQKSLEDWISTRLLGHDQTVHREIDGATKYNDIIEECRKKKLDGASQWPLEDWISTLAKGGGAEKRFQYCLNPSSSNQFL